MDVFHDLIERALREDLSDPDGSIPSGDHSSLASIPADLEHQAYAVAKAEGVVAGIDIARTVLHRVDSDLEPEMLVQDGDRVATSDLLFRVRGRARSILRAERLVLNILQRMSGIATLTRRYVDAVEGTGAIILDTRKTTPGFRAFEKAAVVIGGGRNHRMGLYDMVMLKDNHIDFCGGIEKAIEATNAYLDERGFRIPIEIETRSLAEVDEVLRVGGVTRIMLDNFQPRDVRTAVERIDHRYETEVSGGITLETVRAYAECGPDFISSGSLTHSYRSLDISLKAVK